MLDGGQGISSQDGPLRVVKQGIACGYGQMEKWTLSQGVIPWGLQDPLGSLGGPSLGCCVLENRDPRTQGGRPRSAVVRGLTVFFPRLGPVV
jgi:hypothetical protein